MIRQFAAAEIAALCRQAPEFTEIAARTPPPVLEYDGELFSALVASVISQQLAVKAAAAIQRRVEALLGELAAEKLLAAPPEALRNCGLSANKIACLRGIAEAQASGKIDFAALAERSDAEIVAALTEFRGIGVWTAEMLLIFALGRPDVLSFRDLGIRRGIMRLNRLSTLTAADFDLWRRRYSPFGTLASLYLWRVKDGGLGMRSE